MKTIEDLKEKAMRGKHVVAQINEFNEEFRKLKNLLLELQRYECGNSKEQEIQQQELASVNKFIQNLHPEEVEQRVETLKEEIQERSRHSEVQMATGPDQKSQQQQQNYMKQLEADRKELLELDRMMGLLQNMATESANLLLGQGQTLNIVAERVGRAAKNTKAAKEEMIEAREYTADANRLTIYCCVLITIIVVIILMIFYAAAK